MGLQEKTEFIEWVSDIPQSLLTCKINGEETGIEKISPENLVVRLPGKMEKTETELEMLYYDFQNCRYLSLTYPAVLWEEIEKNAFVYFYKTTIQDTVFSEMFSFVIKQYYQYILLKSQSFGNEFSEKLVGYPEEKEDEFVESYDTWKQTQEEELKNIQLINIVCSFHVQIALSLEHDKLYDCFLKGKLEKIFEEKLLEKAKRIYVGNQFCHHLFPKKELLFQILEKARRDDWEVTLAFSYLRESMRVKTEKLLEEIYAWCEEQEFSLEVLVNDWGMLEMLSGKEAFLFPVLGNLLNKRRKDPRYPYKRSSKEQKIFLKEPALSSAASQAFMEHLGIVRIEFETGGYECYLPEKTKFKYGMHLPLFQTNTSQYCPLYALCTEQNRGKQRELEKCPRYCERYAYLYPKHLHMAGRYNSVFAMDMQITKDILESYQKQGMDRIVWNFV